MFKEMRRKELVMADEKAGELLKDGIYGVLSTVGKDGYAYGMPLNYLYSNGAIYFHSAVSGQKLENLKVGNKVSFCVVGKTEVVPQKFVTFYESVIAFGRAAEIDGDEKREALLAIAKKYSADYMDEANSYINADIQRTKVIKIEIEHISGKTRY